MKPRGIFTIVEFFNASGSISYRVTGTKITGERVQSNFSTSAEATAAKQRLEIEKENLPPAAGLVRTSLTPEQCEEASRAFADLKGRSLAFAVRFFVENYREASTTKA